MDIGCEDPDVLWLKKAKPTRACAVLEQLRCVLLFRIFYIACQSPKNSLQIPQLVPLLQKHAASRFRSSLQAKNICCATGKAIIRTLINPSGTRLSPETCESSGSWLIVPINEKCMVISCELAALKSDYLVHSNTYDNRQNSYDGSFIVPCREDQNIPELASCTLLIATGIINNTTMLVDPKSNCPFLHRSFAHDILGRGHENRVGYSSPARITSFPHLFFEWRCVSNLGTLHMKNDHRPSIFTKYTAFVSTMLAS